MENEVITKFKNSQTITNEEIDKILSKTQYLYFLYGKFESEVFRMISVLEDCIDKDSPEHRIIEQGHKDCWSRVRDLHEAINEIKSLIMIEVPAKRNKYGVLKEL